MSTERTHRNFSLFKHCNQGNIYNFELIDSKGRKRVVKVAMSIYTYTFDDREQKESRSSEREKGKQV